MVVSRRLKCAWQKKRRFALALVWLLLRSFHSTSGGTIGFVSCAIKSSELLSSSRRESAKTYIYILRVRPGRWRSSVDVDVVPRPRDLPRLRHFQQRTRDHLRGARVFDKPVKARPRICLPLAFVTLLVLWLDLELTWKKGPRWYTEQTVRVCPGSTRRTPLSATVACSPTGMRRTRRTTPDDTFHDTFARDRGKRGVSLAPLSLSLRLAYPLQ